MNKITIIGNLTRDPEQRQVSTARGELTNVTTVNLAENTRRGRNAAGDAQDETQFFRVTVWGSRGDAIMRYVRKGHKLFVVGTLSSRLYTANDGTTRVSLEVRADDYEMLTSRAEAEAMSGSYNPTAPAEPGSAPVGGAPVAPTAQNSGFTAVESDDLPF